jgi:hypothetical protein
LPKPVKSPDSRARLQPSGKRQMNRLYPMLLPLMIIGCAGPMGTIHGAAPTAAAVATYDGAYSNTLRVTGSAGDGRAMSLCSSPGQPVITVVNGRFSYAVPHPNAPGNMTSNFPATMAQDGTFSGQVMDGTITGQVNGGHIEGRIDGQGCLYAFAGDRI